MIVIVVKKDEHRILYLWFERLNALLTAVRFEFLTKKRFK